LVPVRRGPDTAAEQALLLGGYKSSLRRATYLMPEAT